MLYDNLVPSSAVFHGVTGAAGVSLSVDTFLIKEWKDFGDFPPSAPCLRVLSLCN